MYPLSYEFRLTPYPERRGELTHLTVMSRYLFTQFRAVTGQLNMSSWFKDVNEIVVSARNNLFGEVNPVYNDSRYFRGYYLSCPLGIEQESGLIIYQPFVVRCQGALDYDDLEIVIVGQTGTNWITDTANAFISHYHDALMALENSSRVQRLINRQARYKAKSAPKQTALALAA
jgi:hypothetical protein